MKKSKTYEGKTPVEVAHEMINHISHVEIKGDLESIHRALDIVFPLFHYYYDRRSKLAYPEKERMEYWKGIKEELTRLKEILALAAITKTSN